MTTVTNATDRELLAFSEAEDGTPGTEYHLAPGDSMDVAPRVALLLEVHGFTLTAQDKVDAIRADDHPSAQPRTGDETRYTGGRHHRSDDPRANVPGTPVQETGDTGSPTNERARELGGADIPGTPVVEHEAPSRTARRRRARVVHPTAEDASVADGTDLSVKVTPQTVDALDAPETLEPSDLALAAAKLTSAADPATRDLVDQAAGQQVDGYDSSKGEDPEDDDEDQDDEDDDSGEQDQPPAQQPDSPTLDEYVGGLRGARLIEACQQAGLDPAGKSVETNRAELRAVLAARAAGA